MKLTCESVAGFSIGRVTRKCGLNKKEQIDHSDGTGASAASATEGEDATRARESSADRFG
jgi:hypothetical protein